MNKIENIIKALDLKPHPEGGYYKETYRCVGEIKKENLSADFNGNRNYSTCIYFLLTSDTFSAFHRIRQDEIWHFYDGSPINLHTINTEGIYSLIVIGNEIEKGNIPQYVVPAGVWFAAKVINENDYSLLGCTVSPGFNFNDFELPNRIDLINNFPQHSKIITELTWK
jgi:predicted cupin superfamily sugar epimerase